MRTTLTITIDTALADFIHQQPGTIDPSVFINTLIHNDMKRQDIGRQKKDIQTQSHKDGERDELSQELELSLDEQIPAAG